MKYVDIHSHVLPGIDDGAYDMKEAVKLCELYCEQGIDTVICTPHYHHSREKSVRSFVERRNKSAEALKAELKKRNVPVPRFIMGAEVLFDCELTEIPDIELLAIENTDYILLEMPESSWQTWMFDYIYDLVAIKDLTPIIAHIERYGQPTKQISKLADMEVYLQINASSLLNPDSRGITLKLMKEGLIQLIATDTHNLEMRPPKLKEALQIIEKKFSVPYARILIENSESVIENEEVIRDIAEFSGYKKKRRIFNWL